MIALTRLEQSGAPAPPSPAVGLPKGMPMPMQRSFPFVGGCARRAKTGFFLPAGRRGQSSHAISANRNFPKSPAANWTVILSYFIIYDRFRIGQQAESAGGRTPGTQPAI